MANHLHRTASHLQNALRPQRSLQQDGRLDLNSGNHALLIPPEHAASKIAKNHQNRERRPLTTIRLGHHDYTFKPIIKNFEGYSRLNLAVLVVGSRGDVQPFIALGKVLAAPPYNHRVRICTHPNFKGFVEENGLEFYSIGGDPEKLMSYMVKNPGIVPSLDAIRSGEVSARRHEIEEMLLGCWRACTEAGDGITPLELPKERYQFGQEEKVFKDMPAPFVADAIISNPPAYANIHIAEKLGIPLHCCFTMPWSATSAFSHPLANVDQDRPDVKFANYMSYYHVELLTWEGLADLVNTFREKTLLLDPVDPAWGYTLMSYLKVPFTYFWSPALIPKPADWANHITVSGFQFLSLASSFKPPQDLEDFLNAGDPPVYIGFGSIVVDDPQKLTSMVLEAVKITGVRALVSKGWLNLGGDDVPDNVFLLGNVPHDWLFPRCSAVVHHGGAGTTAIGVALGKPTVIVPFFGDQPWWGNMIWRAGAGPEPVPYKDLTAEKLADNIRAALEEDVQERARELRDKIQNEDGAETAAKQIMSTKQMQNLGCFILPERGAVWRIKRTNIHLSALAMAVLMANGKIKRTRVKPVRTKIWAVEEGAQDPVIALIASVSTAIIGYIGDARQFTHDLEMIKVKKDDTSRKLTRSDSIMARAPPGKGAAVGRLAKAVTVRTLKVPTNFLYNMANGFHNAPAHLLGDRTVRVRPHITGITSGLNTAVTGGANEIFDGVTGLVTQPRSAFRRQRHAGNDNSAKALAITRGVGRGMGACVFKLCAAVVGLPGYTAKGVEREVERWLGGSDISDEHSGEYMDHSIEWIDRERTARRKHWEEQLLEQRLEQRRLHRRNPADRLPPEPPRELQETHDEKEKDDDDENWHALDAENPGAAVQQLRSQIETEFKERYTHRTYWVKRKGPAAMRRIVERRAWQTVGELHTLEMSDPKRAAELERLILERWEALEVPSKFC